jgi:hypothetical protein
VANKTLSIDYRSYLNILFSLFLYYLFDASPAAPLNAEWSLGPTNILATFGSLHEILPLARMFVLTPLESGLMRFF